MKDKEFNLLDKPWIQVIDADCRVHEVSLVELFAQAHRYEDLCGELPTQDFAVLRLLLAILHTVVSRYDVNGNARMLKDADGALERWQEFWENKRFPEIITEYLESQRERFYLFHPQWPFYQCEHAKAGTEYSAAKLNGNLSESSNKPRLFTELSKEAKQAMKFPEAARWLLYVNAYDDTSAKPSRESKERGEKLPSTGVGWLGKLGILYVAGRNLFETLMLNLILMKETEELFGTEAPVWEREKAADGERTQIQPPDNLSELYTLQSRRLYLKREEQCVTGYYLLGGDFFDKQDAFIEPMTVWRKSDPKKTDNYVPRRHDPAKQFWRECPAAILNENGNRPPGIISWIKYLEEEGVIEDLSLDFRIVSVQYGDKDFFVTNVFSDSLQMHASLIADLNIEWREMVFNSIHFCDKVSKKVEMLARNINLASGGSNRTKDSKGTAECFAQHAKSDFYSRMDRPFRSWLFALDPEVDDAQEKQELWRSDCVRIAKQLGRELMRQAGASAIFGRTKAGSDDRKSETFSAASAMNRFLGGLGALEKM